MAFPFRRKKIRIVCSVVVTAGSTLTTTTSLCRAFTFVPTSPTTVATATARCSRHRGKQKTHQNDFRTKTGSCRPRRLLYSIQQPIHPNQGPADEEELASVWQVGDNVYQDLDRLEQAIAFANADQDLQHQNRLETLNYVAQQRRPVPQDWVQKVVGPWLFSFALASILRCGGRRWQRGIATASSLHFWWWIVGAPMLVLSVQLWTRNSCATTRRRRRCGQQQPPTPEPTQEKNAVPTTELQGLDPNYWRFVTDRQEPPQSSCRDYVLCLLEQWISVVVGVAVAGPFLYHFLNCRSRWCWVLFMAGRLGVMAALHQYPKLWFELMRTQQPRPVPWSVWATQCLVSRQYTPWFTAVDLALFASSSSCTSQPLEWSRINIYYGTGLALASLLAMTARYVTPERTKQVPALPFRPPVKLLARAAAIGWIFGRRQYLMKTFLDSAKLLQTLSVEEFIIYFPWQKVANGLGLGIALLGPVCHLLAFRKLVRLSYTHGLSLAMDVDKYKQALTIAQNQSDGNNSSIAVTGPTTDDDKERRDPSQRLMWRYQLRWREPQRILVTLNQWRRKFGYWLFLAGSVEDKLRREYRTKRQSETKARGLSVLQRIAEEKAKNPQAPMLDRTKWKETAMKRIAEKHQQDYELNTCDVSINLTGTTFGGRFPNSPTCLFCSHRAKIHRILSGSPCTKP